MQVRNSIVKFYKKAIYCYTAPFGFVGLQLLVNSISDFDFQPFLMLFFLSIVPLGILGIVYTKRGYALASSSGDREKKDVGYANFILGAIMLVLGLIAYALAFVMTD